MKCLIHFMFEHKKTSAVTEGILLRIVMKHMVAIP